jgi:NADPH-dependent glutamate synthase beta subunit-like oxidoreductase/2,4-dienoyl-CoA reductase-like NADH-dependent reductase (Old Yellow Enzyme family)
MMWKFQLDSLGDLKSLAQSLSVDIDTTEDLSPLKRPVKVGSLTAPNSMAIHPMEGCDGDASGKPGPLTIRRYTRFAGGGAGLIWAEAIAVVPEGRANPRQLWLSDQNKDVFAEMIGVMRQAAAARFGQDHKPIIVAQLTHSGRYSKPQGKSHPLIPQHDLYRDAMVPQYPPNPDAKKNIAPDWPVITDEYLDGLQEAYVKAARLAFEVGFDAVDIKACHGYLISELLASRMRQGKYGGSFENRTRFLLEVMDKVFAAVGKDKLVGTRMGIYDAIPYPYGWAVDEKDYTKPDLSEPRKLFGLLQQKGVKLVNVTMANPYYNPHVNRPFNETIVGGYEGPEHPLTGVARLLGLTAVIQKEFPAIAMVGTGYSWLRQFMPNVGAAAIAAGKITFVGGGRMGFAYPDFPADIISKGHLDPMKVCVGCSGCTQMMRDGAMAGCVVRDHKVYGPIFEHGRKNNRDTLLRLAQSCRNCQDPMCRRACPAGINIPGFIHKFLDGDDRGAYEMIRQANVFPEVCAWLCPVEQQCQGHCLQKYIGDGALPIADIQRYLSEQANRLGWSKLRLPAKTSGKKIAVIGSGPAGLACAARLLESGHIVTVYDKNRNPGGMIDSVIPQDRQQQALAGEFNAIFSDVPSDRLRFEFGRPLAPGHTLDDIVKQGFDAVFIGMGLPKALRSSDEKLDNLWDALDFLAAAKTPGKLDVKGKRVAVVGGGNTAMDAAVTAKNLGAADVYVVYRRSFAEMPAWTAERDHAVAEGVNFLILTQQLGYLSHRGCVAGIKVCPTHLGNPDRSGRRSPRAVEASAYNLEMDVVIEAIGQKSADGLEKLLPGVTFEDGLIRIASGRSATSRTKVFAGGDLVRGASTVVAAVADGMAAAAEIDASLKA